MNVVVCRAVLQCSRPLRGRGFGDWRVSSGVWRLASSDTPLESIVADGVCSLLSADRRGSSPSPVGIEIRCVRSGRCVSGEGGDGGSMSHIASGSAKLTAEGFPVHAEEFEGRVDGGLGATIPARKRGTVEERVHRTVQAVSDLGVLETISSPDSEVCPEGACSDWHWSSRIAVAQAQRLVRRVSQVLPAQSLWGAVVVRCLWCFFLCMFRAPDFLAVSVIAFMRSALLRATRSAWLVLFRRSAADNTQTLLPPCRGREDHTPLRMKVPPLPALVHSGHSFSSVMLCLCAGRWSAGENRWPVALFIALLF